MLTSLKAQLLGRERKRRRIPAGLYRGLRMEMDLTCELQLYLGLAEVETHAWIRRWSSEVVSAVDVGAANGELVLYWMSCANLRKVYAFEPFDEARERMTRNLESNGYGQDRRLHVSSRFVGSRDDADYCTLDSLDLPGPCMVKIDVDGAEGDVLRGARNLLASGKVFWVVETHSASLEAECMEVFRQAGYRTRIVRNGWYRRILREQRPIPHNRWLVADPGAGKGIRSAQTAGAEQN